jgi:hypothetical protein
LEEGNGSNSWGVCRRRSSVVPNSMTWPLVKANAFGFNLGDLKVRRFNHDVEL